MWQIQRNTPWHSKSKATLLFSLVGNICCDGCRADSILLLLIALTKIVTPSQAYYSECLLKEKTDGYPLKEFVIFSRRQKWNNRKNVKMGYMGT